MAAFLRDAGGDAEVVDWEGSPLAVGELRASTGADSAPTVLVYGHFDVQPPDPLELWQSDPFDLDVRDGWLYARGIADDKGQLYLLLKAAAGLAAEGALPVNVRFACDGEEEVGGHSIIDFLADDDRATDAAVIFDADMPARGVPAFYVATRGIVYMHLRVRAGERDLHSGMYGGAALNAMHALAQTLSGVTARGGRLPEPLRAGVVPPTEEELAGWGALAAGDEVLADQGARPLDAAAGEEFYVRTWAEPSLDVNGIAGGSPFLQKTVIPRWQRRTCPSASRRTRTPTRCSPRWDACSARPRRRARRSSWSGWRAAAPAGSRRARRRSGSPRTPSSARSAHGLCSCVPAARCRSCRRSATGAFRP